MTSYNPREDRRSTSIADVEARADRATNQWDALLFREPNLWDNADVGDKLVGILQVAEEHRDWWEDELVHYPLTDKWQYRRRYSTGRRVILPSPGWWWTYSDLFNRWFLASTPERAQGREAIAAGISDAESYHRAAMESRGIANLWHRMMPIDEWQGMCRLPLIRSGTYMQHLVYTLPGGYLVYDRPTALQAIGTALFKSTGTWGIAHVEGTVDRTLALLVRLPDNRIAGFVGKPWGRLVTSAFAELPPRGPIYRPEVKRTTTSANLAFWGLHFHRPEYYTNVHWEPDPDLAQNISYTAMVGLNRAQFIYTQRDVERALSEVK